jgi:hypothetical protein
MKIIVPILFFGSALSVTPTPMAVEFEEAPAQKRPRIVRFEDEKSGLLSSPDNPLMHLYKQWAGMGDAEMSRIQRQEKRIRFALRPFVRGRKRLDDPCPPLGGSLVLKDALQFSEYGKVFTAAIRRGSEAQGPLVVVKYFTDCHLRIKNGAVSFDQHPLVREWKFMSILNGAGITPEVYYVSPPAVLKSSGEFGTSRFLGNFLIDNMNQCLRLGTHVRYLVQEKVDESVHEYVAKRGRHHAAQFTENLLLVTSRLVDVLATLHKKGIVHGDIHAGNVMLQKTAEGSSRVVLIDFEHAEFMIEGFEKPLVGEPPSDLGVSLLSPWQLQGYRKGPRDDIYRAIEMLARALSRNRFGEGLNDLLRRNNELVAGQSEAIQRDLEVKLALAIKLKAPMFSHSMVVASRAIIGQGLDPAVEAQILAILDSLGDYVRTAYPHPDSPIDYKYIIESLDQAIALL